MKHQSDLGDLNEARAFLQALGIPFLFTAVVCLAIFKVFA